MLELDAGTAVKLSVGQYRAMRSCGGLAGLDNDGPGDKSDPYAIVYFKAEKDKKWTKLGRTETRTDDLNPDFDKVFDINYKFERN